MNRRAELQHHVLCTVDIFLGEASPPTTNQETTSPHKASSTEGYVMIIIFCLPYPPPDIDRFYFLAGPGTSKGFDSALKDWDLLVAVQTGFWIPIN
jgi:hypothetical protein